jgi:hypothetical protein
LLELEGEGETVTDNFDLPACGKAVFYWTAAASDYGTASLILHLRKVGADHDVSLVNEAEFDVPDGIGGAALQPLAGGECYFTSENTDAPWSVRVECQDGQAPAAEGIDVTGEGNAVTANYSLPACDKSVFVWGVEPNDGGTAAIIVHLCKVGEERCVSIANEMEVDLSELLTGETLQGLSGGLYFLTTENLTGPWSVRWECRD